MGSFFEISCLQYRLYVRLRYRQLSLLLLYQGPLGLLFHHFKLRGVYRFLPFQRHAVLRPHGLKLHILIGLGLVGS